MRLFVRTVLLLTLGGCFLFGCQRKPAPDNAAVEEPKEPTPEKKAGEKRSVWEKPASNLMTREAFSAAVIGATPEAVRARLGDPDIAHPNQGDGAVWAYHRRTRKKDRDKADRAVHLFFSQETSRVLLVDFSE